MEREEIVLEGVVERIVYKNRDTGFTVFEIEHEGEPLTVVGEALDLSEGEEVRAAGAFTSHPTYGRQFRAAYFERILPAGSAAILRYLAGGAIRGVGPVLAKRIVDRFGDDTLLVLENEPDRLTCIRGISPQKAREIGEEYRGMIGVRALMLLLTTHGIAPSFAVAAWKQWGALAQKRITDDPYCLCGGEVGLPFEQADALAAQIGIAADAPCRVCGGVLFVLTHNLSNGHACLPLRKLTETAAGLLGVSVDRAEIACDTLREQGLAVGDTVGGEEYLYLPDQFAAEVGIADRIGLMMSFGVPDPPVEAEELDAVERELRITYAERQREAIRTAVSSPVMILTGGPGTGKTTILNGILTLMERRGMTVALAAPTGRAAKRMSEVSGREAKTIHRLLEVDRGRGAGGEVLFKRNERNPLPADAVIIDEMSMVDAKLFASLLRGVRMNCRLVLVGDPDQLPSVGAGNVLRDLIDAGNIPCIHLTEIFRQAAESLIVLSAHAIVSGEMPTLSRTDADFFFLPRDSAGDAAATVADLCIRRLPKAYGFDPARDIQVIAPSRQGGAGTIELNRALQAVLNPPDERKSETTYNGVCYREGDKVMQVRNNYDIEWRRPDGEEGLGIFNGDIGLITMIDRASRTIGVSFDERQTFLSFDQFAELELAYAVTVHKSQGNEFEAVILPVVGQHRRLHYRNLLYTAVTRARRLLILVGQRQSVAAMVANDRKTLRYTNLAARLEAPL